MDDLLQEIAAEEEHIVSTLHALEQAQSRRQRTIVELAAMATFLHNTYSGVEVVPGGADPIRRVLPELIGGLWAPLSLSFDAYLCGSTSPVGLTATITHYATCTD